MASDEGSPSSEGATVAGDVRMHIFTIPAEGGDKLCHWCNMSLNEYMMSNPRTRCEDKKADDAQS